MANYSEKRRTALDDRRLLHPDWEELDFAEIHKAIEDDLAPNEELMCIINCDNTENAIISVKRYRYQESIYYQNLSEFYRNQQRDRYFAKKLKDGTTSLGTPAEDYEFSDNHDE